MNQSKFWESALKLASRITNPTSAAIFALALLIAAFALIPWIKNRTSPRMFRLLVIAAIVLGLSPMAGSILLAYRGIYHIRVVVLDPSGHPVDQAELRSSAGGEFKQGSGNWEFDLAPQSSPSNKNITFYARLSDAYLSGSSTLELGAEYYPTVYVHLAHEKGVHVMGIVLDEKGHSLSGVKVSLPGYPGFATTDEVGNFSILSPFAEGQLVEVRAENGRFSADKWVIAGKQIEIVLAAN